MIFTSERYINELIMSAHAKIRKNPEDALEQAERILGMLDDGTLVSESPQVIVDKARALRDRAKLAALYERTNRKPVKDDGLDDLERLWLGQK
jgi:hypothetical protein